MGPPSLLAGHLPGRADPPCVEMLMAESEARLEHSPEASPLGGLDSHRGSRRLGYSHTGVTPESSPVQGARHLLPFPSAWMGTSGRLSAG